VTLSLLRLEQIIEIGPMSGKSNVIFWLERRGMTASEELVDRIFQRAKASDRCLTEEEILACCQRFRPILSLITGEC